MENEIDTYIVVKGGRVAMRTFEVKKEDRIVIYGAAYVGVDLCRKVLSLGFDVDAFMDRKADSLGQVEGRKVFLPEAYDGKGGDTVVIIATSNPVSVANYLLSMGYERIIYNAVVNQASPKAVRLMSSAYQKLASGGGFAPEIPYYEVEMDERFLDGAMIGQDGDKVLAYVPTDLLFEKDGNGEGHIYVRHADLLTYLAAFDGNVENLIETISSYVSHAEVEKLNGEDFELSPRDRISYTQSRLNEMNLQLNRGMDWFVKNPISVCAGDDKFYVQRGDLFKVFFLLSKGLQRIPAVMPKSDYDKWVNQGVLREVIAYAQKRDMVFSYTPLEHPNFFNFPVGRDIGGNERMIRICQFLKGHGIEVSGKKVIDIGSYYGYLSRFFARMGSVVSAVEFDEEIYGMSVHLNKLMHLEKIESILGGAQDLKRDHEFDIAIMLTVLYWHLDTPLGLELIHAVDNMTKSLLIWESGGEPDREKKFVMDHSSFSGYYKICETTGSGLLRELGVFYK